jgi:hypothetical protein
VIGSTVEKETRYPDVMDGRLCRKKKERRCEISRRSFPDWVEIGIRWRTRVAEKFSG